MFDIAWTEMLFLVVLTVLVVGPKDLPRVMRSIGGFMRKIRNMAGDFMDGVDDLARENDLQEVTRQIKNVKTGNVAGFIGEAIDPDGELGGLVDEVKTATSEPVKKDEKKPAKEKTKTAPKKKAAKKKTVKKKSVKKASSKKEGKTN